ncbi:MAG: energy-coupling factor transporter transmembrane component T [Chloroflexia bacterium]
MATEERYREEGNVFAWTVWLVAAALPALTTRNPGYLILLLLVVAVVYGGLPAPGPQEAGRIAFLRFGCLLWIFTVPLNALTAHYGHTVLFLLPRSLPVVGGPVTLEAVVYGFLSGLGLLAVVWVFATYNRAVDPYRLLRALPPVFFQTGVMLSIALTFVPQAAAALREIREAQRIRGHRWRGLRDLVPLLLPLLTTGLERAAQMAESMEARGFGAAPLRSPRAWRWAQALLLPSLLLLLSGLLWRGFGGAQGPWASVLLALGAGGLLLSLFLRARAVGSTRYRRQHWSLADTWVAMGSALFALGYLVVRFRWPEALSFSPYPQLAWPSFRPALGAAFLALVLPALCYGRAEVLPGIARHGEAR